MKLNIQPTYFNEKYLPYLNSDYRYNVYYGGAGSGKSRFLATKLILDLCKSKTKLLVIRQTFASIRDSVYAEFMTVLDDMKLLGTKYVKVSKTTLAITFFNGSEIIYKGADDETKLLSISGVDVCWVEEASQVSYELWTQLKLRLRGGSTRKKFYLSFNPISATHWLKSEFFDNPMDDSVIVHSTYLDNRFLDDEYIKDLEDMKIRNPLKYDVYALGKWGVLGKKIYENWTTLDFNISELIKENPNLVTAIGCDFGFINDPTTLVCSLVDLDNRQLYIFDELYEKGLLNNEIAERIIDKGYSKSLIIADSAEQKSIAEIKGYGIPRITPARKGKGSIMNGIQYIQQFEIFVHPNCKHTIDELEQYAFKKDKATGLYINEPIDAHNHILDGLRYSLEAYMRKVKMTTLNKALFGL